MSSSDSKRASARLRGALWVAMAAGCASSASEGPAAGGGGGGYEAPVGGSGGEGPVTGGADAGTLPAPGTDGGGVGAVATPPDAAAQSTVTVAPPPGPRFPVVAMRLSPTAAATGPDAQIDVELRADGTIHSHGQFVGQLQGDRIVDGRGREILAVAPDGTVSLSGTPTRIRLLESGEVTMPNRATLAFSDDGAPMTTAAGQPPRRGPLQLTGLVPEARRTAALLAVLVATVSLPH